MEETDLARIEKIVRAIPWLFIVFWFGFIAGRI